MSAAFLLDVASYYFGLVIRAYRNPEQAFLELPFQGRAGQVAARVMRFYNRRLVTLAKTSPRHRTLRPAQFRPARIVGWIRSRFSRNEIVAKGIIPLMESRTHELPTDVCRADPGVVEGNVSGIDGPGVTGGKRRWWRDFAVHGIFWRRFVDWSVRNLPATLHRPLIWTAACLFFFIAAPARKALLRNLRLVDPGSWRVMNYFRVVRVFANFGWSLTDAAAYRLKKGRFRYEMEGGRFLDKLGSAKGAIVLTAHMGNYDLGAALFAERFDRQLRMVRAPEPDALAAKHVDLALRESSSGGVKVGYSDDGTALALDLLSALRAGEIISIQGDRVVGEVARAPVNFSGRKICLPNGPFVLSLVSETPIYPLFIVRTGYRKYKIVAREPILCARTNASRDEAIAAAMQRWAVVLQEIGRAYWPQWFAFKPLA